MKRNTLIVNILLWSSFAYSQNVNIEEIVSMNNTDINYVVEHLQRKGWTVDKSTDEFKKGSVYLSYKKNLVNNEAEAFIIISYSSFEEYPHRFKLTTFSEPTFNQYESEIKSLNSLLIQSNYVDGEQVTVYRNSTITFRVGKTSMLVNAKGKTYSEYGIWIMDNANYIKLLGN